MAEILLLNDAEVNPELTDDYPFCEPPLHYAVKEDDIEMARLLLDAGANVNCLNNTGDISALSVAIKMGVGLNCIQLLLEAGANVDTCRIDGEHAIDYAYYHDMRETHSRLLRFSQQAKTSLFPSGIISAAKQGVQALETYVKSRPDVLDFARRHALELALYNSLEWDHHGDAVGTLLDFGVDPNIPSIARGKTLPLVFTAWFNDMSLAERLIDAGADINDVVLEAAVEEEEQFEFLGFLIEKGANLQSLGPNALCGAISNSNYAAVKLLISAGVNVNRSSSLGRYPIQSAAFRNNVEIFRYLLKAGADINATNSKDGSTALHGAAEQGNIEMIQLLLELGCQIRSQRQTKLTKTLLEACANWRISDPRQAKVFKFLLQSGAELSLPRTRRRFSDWNSALTLLIKQKADKDLIHIMLERDCDVNEAGGGDGARTPIQVAAERGDLELVKILLAKGANINAPAAFKNGRTALQAACGEKDVDMNLVKFLLNEGANVNADAGADGCLTALQGAAIRGHTNLALLLLNDYGAEVNAEPALRNGRTALEGAAEYGRLDMVQILLNADTSGDAERKSRYKSAVELAEKNCHYGDVDLLNEFHLSI